MIERTTPLILFSQFSTIVGAHDFATPGLAVERFQGGNLTLWRGELTGDDGPQFGFYLEESDDQETWTYCSGAAGQFDPGADQEVTLSFVLSKRWLRGRAELTGTKPGVSLWAHGFVQARGKS
jgi:hypothetical protein